MQFTFLYATLHLAYGVVVQGCPFINDPVCGVDGKEYVNSCLAKRHGVKIAIDGRCPKGNRYGGTDGGCACPRNINRVCGRDGQDYDNKCLAKCAGTTVAYPGRCRLNSRTSIGPHSLPPVPGTCDECHDDFRPVCASDGETYKNYCFAECKKLTVVHEGYCNSVKSSKSGRSGLIGRTGISPSSSGRMGSKPWSGRWLPPPPRDCDSCSQEYDPVCGTDGKTYMNTCLCRCNPFVGVAYKGICHKTGVDPRKKWRGSKASTKCNCPKSYIPVCGFTRLTYSNACLAKCAGTGVYYKGACNPHWRKG